MFKFKKLKLPTVTDSGDEFCNLAAILRIVQNLWLVLDLFIFIFSFLSSDGFLTKARYHM
jgi:hypothetical protein